MKKISQKYVYILPMILWIVIIPLVVKLKFFINPLNKYDWYSTETSSADFFLYWKSCLLVLAGGIMLLLLCRQIVQMKKKDGFVNYNMQIFIPLIIYLILAVLSSLFSPYKYFCMHGIAEQFESIWCLGAYVLAAFYGYYLIMYQSAEKQLFVLIYMSAILVGVICVLQYCGIDVFRLVYAGKGYSFTFEKGTVYGTFYNTNYVGYYTLLFTPLFVLFAALYKNWKIRLISILLVVALVISMVGANSITAIIVSAIVVLFAVFYILLKKVKQNKVLRIPIIGIFLGCLCITAVFAPRIYAYVQASDTEKTNLQNIFTRDECVEVNYKGDKLCIQMNYDGERYDFGLRDGNSDEVMCRYTDSEDGYYYYEIIGEPFNGIKLVPMLLSEEPEIYGFSVVIDEKDWIFTNEVSEDGTYYYYTNYGKMVKLTSANVSKDFAPLVDKSSLASGRGYIWNKTLAILKDYVLLGSGPDTFTLAYPNGDFVDRYNNGYDGLIITKPHNLYLQIAVQTGVLSLICFLVFYCWYFVSSLRIYFGRRLDNPLAIGGFAIMLGTLGYMLSGLANDSTVTVSPLYWALLGIGIGINQRIRDMA